MRRREALLCLLLALGLASGAQAQTDGDLALLTGAAGVPPNVMLVLDTSGSMENQVWHDDFDQKVFWNIGSPTSACVRKPVSGGSWTAFSVPVVAGTDGQCPGSGEPNDACPDNEAGFRVSDSEGGHYLACPEADFAFPCAGMSAGECTVSGGWVMITLTDLEGTADDTRFSMNYAHWWLGQLMAAGAAGFGPIPQQTRNQGAKQAIATLVNDMNPDLAAGGYEENVRFGLARFSGDNGGYVIEPIASNNKAALLARLPGITPDGWTPVSETLVDVARYFTGEHQNLGSYGAYNRSTTDGSYTSAPPPSPIDPALPCQSNFVVLLTDGNPTQDLNDHHGTAFANTIGDWDGDGNDPGAGPNGASDWLDDVAGYLYNTDLIDDSVALGIQNIVTYTVGFSVDLPILQETAANGGGSYYTTSNADVLAAQLKDALQDILERSASFASVAVPSSKTSFGANLFNVYFEPKQTEAMWAGHLEAYRLGDDFEVLGRNDQPAIDPATGDFVDPRVPIWDAGDKLAGTNGEPVHPPRLIYTTDTAAPARQDFTTATIDFTRLGVTAADLPLYAGGPFADEETLTDAIVDFIYGLDAFDEDLDGATAETRETVLGDSFHSSPALVATPPPFLLSEPGFGPPEDSSSFFGRYALRDRRLYMGANDGMLHAIRAGRFETGDNPATPEVENGYYDVVEQASGSTGGQEAFGYVPGLLLGKLKELPLQTINDKKFYVDGSPRVGDAWLPSGPNDVSKESSEWATVMVTGMRRGGDGYLALDVSDPKAQARPYPGLLWEFTDPAQPLGESWSQPVISRVRVRGGPGGDHCDAGTLPPPDCVERWVAIFAGGYRESGDAALPTYIADPADPAWDSDSKAVFVVDLASGSVLARLAYDPADAQLAEMKFSLPSDPAVLDIDFDGFTDLIYVGDTGGQLWKWDVSQIGQIDATTGLVTNWPAGRFFAAPVASNGRHKSIFKPPVASFVDGDLLLAFATGERSDPTHQHDPALDDENRFYVIQDPDPLGASAIPAAPYDESYLSQLNGFFEDPVLNDLGFYLIAEPDEKFITSHLAFAGFAITASFKPGSVATACEGADGTSFVYVFELDGGGGFFSDDGSGPASTRRLEIGPGAPSDPRITSDGTENRVFITVSDGGLASVQAPDSDIDNVGLVYWRQQF